jgi:hypothetical protein
MRLHSHHNSRKAFVGTGALLLILTAGAATAYGPGASSACPASESSKSCQEACDSAKAQAGACADGANATATADGVVVLGVARDDDEPAQVERRVRGSANRPLGAGDEQARSTSITTMSQSDGKDSFTIKISGDEIKAEHNGNAVPAERVKREGNRIRIVDEEGNTLSTFNVGSRTLSTLRALPQRDGNVWMAPRQPGLGGGGGGPAVAMTVPGQTPPVMLGVTMGEPDQSVLDFLGIKAGVRLDRVVEDLPAAKAGLREGDLIVGVNGKPSVSQAQLREILMAAEPGDELAVSVVRRGEGRKEYKITLAKWDGAKLGVTTQPQAQAWAFGDQNDGGQGWIVRPFNQRAWDEAQRKLEEAMARVKTEVDVEKLKKEATAALGQAMKSLAEARENASRQFRGMQINPELLLNERGAEGREPLRMFGQGGEVFTLPQQAERMAGQVERLNDRIEKLEGRLDEVIRLLQEQNKNR